MRLRSKREVFDKEGGREDKERKSSMKLDKKRESTAMK